MPIGLDVGTMWLVKAVEDPMTNDPVFYRERNAFLQLASNEDTEDILAENDWSYIKHQDNYYILGELSLKIKNMLTAKSAMSDNSNIVVADVGDLRRPMQNGVINTAEDKMAVAIIQQLIGNLVGESQKENEVVCFCSPAGAINSNVNVGFHEDILKNFIKTLGYKVESIPEAQAIIFAEDPIAEDPEDGTESEYSGIAMSYGSGMTNVVLSWKKMPVISFSICEAGDWVDQQTANIAGCDRSAVTRYKEAKDRKSGKQKFDLSNIDYSNTIESGLEYSYKQLISKTLKEISSRFTQLETQINAPLEIVVAGGTASVPGFMDIFNNVLEDLDLPFEVKNSRLASNPLFSVASGCLAKAMSVEKKLKDKETKED